VELNQQQESHYYNGYLKKLTNKTNMSKEEFYKYGELLGIKINDLQRLKMLAVADKKYSEQDIQNVLDGFTNEAPGQYIKTNFIELLNKQII